ncbi:MAG: ornithine cyclodeaminase family protein [Chloroflexota bacterium]
MIAISGSQLRDMVSMSDAIQAVRRAFEAVSAGQADQPPRLVLGDGGDLAMMARLPAGLCDGTSVKVVTVRRENAVLGLPTIHSLVLWLDGPTGIVLAQIDGSALTALRTGAASGVATDLLAARNARLLAMIGAGGQAADQVGAVLSVRPIEQVNLFSRTRNRTEEVAAVLRRSFPEVRFEVSGSASQATLNADVICCATTATVPLFEIADIRRDVHINAVGSYRPEMVEIHPLILGRAAIIVVDQVQAAMAEAGDIIQAIQSGNLQVDRLVEIGSLPAGYQRPSGITVFKSVGLAAQDWAVAQLAVARAGAAGLAVPASQLP